jgi:hypothetical protein
MKQALRLLRAAKRDGDGGFGEALARAELLTGEYRDAVAVLAEDLAVRAAYGERVPGALAEAMITAAHVPAQAACA